MHARKKCIFKKISPTERDVATATAPPPPPHPPVAPVAATKATSATVTEAIAATAKIYQRRAQVATRMPGFRSVVARGKCKHDGK